MAGGDLSLGGGGSFNLALPNAAAAHLVAGAFDSEASPFVHRTANDTALEEPGHATPESLTLGEKAGHAAFLVAGGVLGGALGSLVGPGTFVLGAGLGTAAGEFAFEWQHDGLDHLQLNKILSAFVVGTTAAAAGLGGFALGSKLMVAGELAEAALGTKLAVGALSGAAAGASVQPAKAATALAIDRNSTQAWGELTNGTAWAINIAAGAAFGAAVPALGRAFSSKPTVVENTPVETVAPSTQPETAPLEAQVVPSGVPVAPPEVQVAAAKVPQAAPRDMTFSDYVLQEAQNPIGPDGTVPHGFRLPRDADGNIDLVTLSRVEDQVAWQNAAPGDAPPSALMTRIILASRAKPVEAAPAETPTPTSASTPPIEPMVVRLAHPIESQGWSNDRFAAGFVNFKRAFQQHMRQQQPVDEPVPLDLPRQLDDQGQWLLNQTRLDQTIAMAERRMEVETSADINLSLPGRLDSHRVQVKGEWQTPSEVKLTLQADRTVSPEDWAQLIRTDKPVAEATRQIETTVGGLRSRPGHAPTLLDALYRIAVNSLSINI